MDKLFAVPVLYQFSLQYGEFLHAVEREVSKAGGNVAESRIIDQLIKRPHSQKELRALTEIERGQLSRAINSMIKRGIVGLAGDTSERWPTYRLTTDGWTLYRKLCQTRGKAIERALQKMKWRSRRAFFEAANRLSEIQLFDDTLIEPDRFRTAYPEELTKIIDAALSFYKSNFPYKFNRTIESYVLQQFARARDSSNNFIIIYEWRGSVAGSLSAIVDHRNATAHLEAMWFSIGWGHDEHAVALIGLAKQRVSTGNCKRLTARIPQGDQWPNVYDKLGWTLEGEEMERVTGVDLTFQNWSLILH